jgi:hypothetical protein
MSKLVKQIHDLISLAIDKGYTQYISDSQIDDAIDQAQMVLFRQLVKQFPRDKRVRNDLMPFEVQEDITITSKVGSLPSAFEHEIEFWSTGGATGATAPKYPVTLAESGFYRRRVLDVVDPPSATNLFATIYNAATGPSGPKIPSIEVSNQVSPVKCVYFKRPTKPVYGVTGPTNGQYIYDDTVTTDVDWSPTMHDFLVEKSLAILGLNMRDGAVMRAGQAAEPKEATL